MVFLPNLGVNLRACLCGVVNYASAQALDFLDLGQKSSFLDWKLQNVPIFDNSLLWVGTSYVLSTHTEVQISMDEISPRQIAEYHVFLGFISLLSQQAAGN
jgi:outer membrane protease